MRTNIDTAERTAQRLEKNAQKLDGITLYSLSELEPILGATHRTLLNYISNGRLKAIKIGGKWKVTEESLNEFLNPPKEYTLTVQIIKSLMETKAQENILELSNKDYADIFALANDEKETIKKHIEMLTSIKTNTYSGDKNTYTALIPSAVQDIKNNKVMLEINPLFTY